MSHTVAQRYAQALFDLAQTEDAAGPVYRDMQMITRLIARSQELRDFLKNPVVPLSAQQIMFEQVFKTRVHPLMYCFIRFVAAKKRLGVLAGMGVAFELLYLRANNTVKVKITTSTPLTDRHFQDVTDRIKQRLHKEVLSEATVNASLLGGIRIQAGHTIYDGSLRTQLERFKKAVMTA